MLPLKADPNRKAAAEKPPATASVVVDERHSCGRIRRGSIGATRKASAPDAPHLDLRECTAASWLQAADHDGKSDRLGPTSRSGSCPYVKGIWGSRMSS